MFAHAINSTMPVIDINKRSGTRASRCIELWPRAPSSTVIFFALNWVSVCALIPS
jgi:hypothetical protein